VHKGVGSAPGPPDLWADRLRSGAGRARRTDGQDVVLGRGPIQARLSTGCLRLAGYVLSVGTPSRANCCPSVRRVVRDCIGRAAPVRCSRVGCNGGMAMDLFAGIPVREYAAAVAWYERLLGGPPAFLPNDVEAVWELAEHRYVYIVKLPERAGNAELTMFVDDLDSVVDGIAARGIEPAKRETYDNGVRKITYRDPDGSEFSYGGGPAEA
jgi:hypothetical protein